MDSLLGEVIGSSAGVMFDLVRVEPVFDPLGSNLANRCLFSSSVKRSEAGCREA